MQELLNQLDVPEATRVTLLLARAQELKELHDVHQSELETQKTAWAAAAQQEMTTLMEKHASTESALAAEITKAGSAAEAARTELAEAQRALTDFQKAVTSALGEHPITEVDGVPNIAATIVAIVAEGVRIRNDFDEYRAAAEKAAKQALQTIEDTTIDDQTTVQVVAGITRAVLQTPLEREIDAKRRELDQVQQALEALQRQRTS